MVQRTSICCVQTVRYIPVHTSTYTHVLVHTCSYLYILVDHKVGRGPLILLFLAGNSTPTIPHKFSKHKGSVFPFGCADSTTADGRSGSNVYEVNMWLWNFGRASGKLTVDETAMRKKMVKKD